MAFSKVRRCRVPAFMAAASQHNNTLDIHISDTNNDASIPTHITSDSPSQYEARKIETDQRQ